jgi:hypothetical protein
LTNRECKTTHSAAALLGCAEWCGLGNTAARCPARRILRIELHKHSRTSSRSTALQTILAKTALEDSHGMPTCCCHSISRSQLAMLVVRSGGLGCCRWHLSRVFSFAADSSSSTSSTSTRITPIQQYQQSCRVQRATSSMSCMRVSTVGCGPLLTSRCCKVHDT